MKRFLCCLIILISFLSLAGCEPVSVGNSSSGYETVPDAKIQPEEAVKLVDIYVDKTFDLRIKDSDLKRKEGIKPIIFVTLKDDFYYIVQENYPAKSVYFYLDHAVRIHKNTGEIIPPE